MLKGFQLKPPERDAMNKNLLNVMFGVVGGVIAAEFIIKKTPLGRMLGI